MVLIGSLMNPPPFGLSKENCKKFNYNVFSARTGNIYTTSLLKQWTEWALEKAPVPEEMWIENGRYFDPFRPNIEPNGFESLKEVKTSQLETIAAFRTSIKNARYFVFTLGLTESWVNSEFGYEYPMCPGTVAGKFDETKHTFINQQFSKILENLSSAVKLMKEVNPGIKFILTVSPVPLTATKSGRHVAVATMASKSILRAVADQMATNRANVDYFPSYEIINSPIFRGSFFEPNQRSVNPHGVNFVMSQFFSCLETKFGKYAKVESRKKTAAADFCEEALLEAFSK